MATIERWDVARAAFTLAGSTTVDMSKLSANPCPDRRTPAIDDCLLPVSAPPSGG